MKIVLRLLIMLGYCAFATTSVLASAIMTPEAKILTKNYYEPGRALITPHIEWLKPYYGGKIKTLFIVPRTGMREVVELAERMDLDYRVFSTFDDKQIVLKSSGIGGNQVVGDTYDERINVLDNLLMVDYDVIVVSEVDWQALPQDARLNILTKVKGGTGLVGILKNPDDTLKKVMSKVPSPAEYANFASIFSGFPFQSGAFQDLKTKIVIQDLAALLLASAQPAVFGKGKICQFRYYSNVRDWSGPYHVLVPGPSPGSIEQQIQRNQTDYDYQLAFVIRAMLWASGKTPVISITPVEPTITVDSPQSENTVVDFRIANPTAIKSLESHFFVLDELGQTVFEQRRITAITVGENDLSWSLPHLPIGMYRANLIASSNGKALDFATCIMQVTGSTRIDSLVFEKVGFKQGEPARAQISLLNPPEGSRLHISHYDNYGRMIEERNLPIVKPKNNVEFSTAYPMTILQWVRVELVNPNGIVLHSFKGWFAITDLYPPNDDMRFILWNHLPGGGPFYMLPILQYWRECGVDTHYASFSGYVPLANMWEVGILSRLIDIRSDWYPNGAKKRGLIDDDLIRVPCLTAPDYRAKLKTSVMDRLGHYKDFSIKDFATGDENHFCGGPFDLCFSPTCISDFKRFVREKYGSIDILNREYGTAYKAFDEVEPMPLDMAVSRKQISRWVDHRMHMDSTWADVFGYIKDIVSEAMPEARVGYEGSDPRAETYAADDYWKLSRNIALNNLYARPFQAALWSRSISCVNGLFGLGWFGGYGSPFDKIHHFGTQYYPWKSLFNGANSLWVWHANPMSGSVTAPEYAFYDFFKDTLNAVKEIKGGLAKAILRSKMDTDIGIYYSPASIHTATFLNSGLGKDSFLQDITQLVTDLGYTPRIFAYKEVEDGVLTRERPKALYLPYVVSVSPQEALQLRDYVKSGGILIADVTPCVRNAQGKLLPQGALDDVFGVKLSGEAELRKAPLRLTSTGARIEGKCTEVYYDSLTACTTGVARGTIGDPAVPALIWNTCGKGRSLLLNFAIGGYWDAYTGWLELGGQYRELLGGLLRQAGIQPAIRVEPEISGLSITMFTSGGIRYVTLLQDSRDDEKADTVASKPVMIKVGLPGVYHVYNVREGRYLGNSSSVSVALRPLDGVILALLPYKTGGVKLSVLPTAVSQGESLRYHVQVLASEPHIVSEQIVRIQVFNPNGKEIEYYSKNLPVKGMASDEINLALNDKEGKWRIVATDVISKSKVSADFIVKGVKR